VLRAILSTGAAPAARGGCSAPPSTPDATALRPRVQAVVADFELAVWKAVRQVLPGVTQRGCAFHFGQAVWRNIQAVGLQTAYTMLLFVPGRCRSVLGPKCLGSEVSVLPPKR